MSKNLEELKKDGKDIQYYDGLGVGISIMYYLVPILEDYEKRLKAVETELVIYTDEEIKNIKIGGTDPD